MAYTSSPTCTKRTTWREMPRGRLASRSSGQVARGLCQGSVNIFGFELAAVIFNACGSAESACSPSALTDVAFSARGSIWGNSFNSMCSILRGAWEVQRVAATSARYVYGLSGGRVRQKEKPRSYAGLFQRGHKRGRERPRLMVDEALGPRQVSTSSDAARWTVRTGASWPDRS